MRYSVDITREKLVQKFTDNEGVEFVSTWVIDENGKTTTSEIGLGFQMEKLNKYDKCFTDIIGEEDLDEIWSAIRNRKI